LVGWLVVDHFAGLLHCDHFLATGTHIKCIIAHPMLALLEWSN
jgi:hypothetical protein